MAARDATHDPALRSWVASANEAGTDFPIQNLPFAVFRRRGSAEAFRGGVAIGDQILDLAAAAHNKSLGGAFDGVVQQALQAASNDSLNALMALGQPVWSALRLALSRALREGSPAQAVLQTCLVPQAEAEYGLPARIGDYTDFYTSVHHATNIGKQFRPAVQPLRHRDVQDTLARAEILEQGIAGRVVIVLKPDAARPGERQPGHQHQPRNQNRYPE